MGTARPGFQDGAHTWMVPWQGQEEAVLSVDIRMARVVFVSVSHASDPFLSPSGLSAFPLLSLLSLVV